MENVAATQLPSIQKRRFTTAFQAKDIENKSRLFHLKQRMQQSGPLEHGMVGLNREFSVEEQQ